ncbi:MAG: aromatic aminobenezylarsenical efflux permease ArsG family transporter, partial [Syntrophales bacterium LBB04]|nr:aromatic aminobenezylarsenical efflux permease ArsG family transporter [Syntrophales bacterium LBB04]
LGILTTISPCPLATNLAAVSFITRELNSPWRTVLSGLLYASGRCLAYTVLAWLILHSLLEIQPVALFLQSSMNRILGPLLIVVGLFLLGIIRLHGINSNWIARLGEKISRHGIWGSFFLGALFAFSFCPVSAALYFGSLIPIAVEKESTLILPIAYGIGTGLPVLALAMALLGGLQTASSLSRQITRWEKPARLITGGVFLAGGIYYVYNYLILPGF